MHLCFKYFLLCLSLLAEIEALQWRSRRPIRKRTCSTFDPTANLTATHKWLQENEKGDNDLWNGTMIRDRVQKHHHLGKRTLAISDFQNPYHIDRRQLDSALFTIDTYIHIVADSANAQPTSSHYVKDEQIQKQIAYLNNAYAAAGIAYRLMNISRTVNDTWARNGDDIAMKQALRQGTYSTLNIYYQTLLQDTDPSMAPSPNAFLLGFCTLPTTGITSQTSPQAYITDGCNVLSGTLPGSWRTGYNLGGTTTHEVGHWNGLLHTFQGYSCDADDWGDYVADTPQQASATTGCPTKQDSCPDSGIAADAYDGTGVNPYGPQGYSGPDMITNFMDYSVDACYQGFTPGQAARMANLWVIYRQGK